MRILILIGLCLVVSTISAEKKLSHKHAETKKLLKTGHEKHHDLKEAASLKPIEAPKSPLPLKEELAQHKSNGSVCRKHHRHGKNRKGGQHAAETQQQQQNGGANGRPCKGHHAKPKPKVNNNGPTKPHHNKHGRKNGRGKQQMQ